jgi:hypothetical protein
MKIFFLIGPVLGILGCAALVISALRRGGSVPRNIRALWPLTEDTEGQLLVVGDMLEPYKDALGSRSIPMNDIIAVYFNSRENMRLANKARLDTGRPDCVMFLERIQCDHSKIKRLAGAALLERGVGTLIPWQPLYSRVLLWTYAEEQELLDNLAEYCADEHRRIILSRI